jgi:hypothetical protein
LILIFSKHYFEVPQTPVPSVGNLNKHQEENKTIYLQDMQREMEKVLGKMRIKSDDVKNEARKSIKTDFRGCDLFNKRINRNKNNGNKSDNTKINSSSINDDESEKALATEDSTNV